MNKIVAWIGLSLVLLVGCASTEEMVSTLTAVDVSGIALDDAMQELNDIVVDVVDSQTIPSGAENGCDPSQLPDPQDGRVMVQFANKSHEQVQVFWNDAANGNELVPVTHIDDQGVYNQEAAVGDEWVIKNEENHALLTYEATSASKQCATVHPHWAYAGEEGPDHWSQLTDYYAQCNIGQQQSPISLYTDDFDNVEEIEIHYTDTAVNILNNGHTVEVKDIEGNHIVVDGQEYHLEQFHFHALSEHTVDDNHYPVEMHLVHKNELGQLAVIGVFLAEGAENAAFYPVWDFLPEEEIGTIDTEMTVNVAMLLPADQWVYRYDGSLTTPPCSEGVKWLVMPNSVPLSAGQIAAISQILHHNNRPPQRDDTN